MRRPDRRRLGQVISRLALRLCLGPAACREAAPHLAAVRRLQPRRPLLPPLLLCEKGLPLGPTLRRLPLKFGALLGLAGLGKLSRAARQLLEPLHLLGSLRLHRAPVLLPVKDHLTRRGQLPRRSLLRLPQLLLLRPDLLLELSKLLGALQRPLLRHALLLRHLELRALLRQPPLSLLPRTRLPHPRLAFGLGDALAGGLLSCE